MSNYSIKGLPFRSGIGVNTSDCKTSKDCIVKAGLDFTVEKCPLVAKMPFDIDKNNNISEVMEDFSYNGNIYRACQGAYATYRTDTNIPLGVVKSKYEVVQNNDAFAFIDDIVQQSGAQYISAGCFGYGSRVFITVKLNKSISVKGDEVNNYLVIANSHDGTISLNILYTPIRVACLNTLNAAISAANAYIRFRHTKNAKDKINEGLNIIKAANDMTYEISGCYNRLANTPITDKNVIKYITYSVLNHQEIDNLWDYDNKLGVEKLINHNSLTMEATGISTRKVNIINKIIDYYYNGIAQKEIVGTAWGAYNAVTGYYSNSVSMDGEKRMNNLLYGSSYNSMQNAFNLINDMCDNYF